MAPAHRIRELGTLVGMVHAGIGVSVAPECEPMLPAGLVLVPLSPSAHRRPPLSGPASRPLHPAVTALVAAAA